MPRRNKFFGDGLLLCDEEIEKPCTIIIYKDGRVEVDGGAIPVGLIIEALEETLRGITEEVENGKFNSK